MIRTRDTIPFLSTPADPGARRRRIRFSREVKPVNRGWENNVSGGSVPMEDERRKDLPLPVDASAPRYASYRIPTVPYLPGLGTERPPEGEMLVPFERS